MIEVESFGGADTVTGSCHLMTLKKGKVALKILVDAGLFQGAESKVHRVTKDLPFSIHDIEAIFLTHAHLDHCGLLPLLCLKGYSGPIYMTEATKELAAIILKDSAKIQQESCRRHNKTIEKKSRHLSPLYRTQDVERCLNLAKIIQRQEVVHLKDFEFSFYQAGHIPGASSLSVFSKGIQKRILFSGDLGRVDDLIMRPPAISGGHDVVFIESTYGGHNHAQNPTIKEELVRFIKDIKNKGSVLLIPAFTVARTQMLLCLLSQLMKKRPEIKCPIILDSPMGLEVNKVFERHLDDLKLDSKAWKEMFEEVYEVEEKWQESKVRSMPEGHIVISSSGMMTGGKVVSHFARLAFDPDNIIFLPGYQSKGTLGRKLLDGERSFETDNEVLEVKCQIYHSYDLSAHADQQQLTSWLKEATQSIDGPSVFLIHGEDQARLAFKKHLLNANFSQVELMEFRSPTTIL